MVTQVDQVESRFCVDAGCAGRLDEEGPTISIYAAPTGRASPTQPHQVTTAVKAHIKMHELLLFASVPAHQHYELLQQLAGLTAMRPRHRLERHLVFKAHSNAGRINTRIGGSQDLQGGEVQRLSKMLSSSMYYTQVVGLVAERDFGAPADQYDIESQTWRMEWRDIPEAGTRSAVTSRLMANVSLPQGDMLAPMNSWGYK
jgi:mediator of RNA polymerase II transcription subunit 18